MICLLFTQLLCLLEGFHVDNLITELMKLIIDMDILAFLYENRPGFWFGIERGPGFKKPRKLSLLVAELMMMFI